MKKQGVVVEEVASLRLKFHILLSSHMMALVATEPEIFKESYRKTPNRAKQALSGEMYAHFKVHQQISYVAYIGDLRIQTAYMVEHYVTEGRPVNRKNHHILNTRPQKSGRYKIATALRQAQGSSLRSPARRATPVK